MEPLNICWWDSIGNWGDALNEKLCNELSGRNIIKIPTDNKSSTFRYYCIGSILQTISSNNFEIWGTGFINSNSKIHFKPNKIHAVRGPLTREILLKQDYYCPEIFGDPALLYPRFYKPNIIKKYKYGIIPHYIDKKNPWIESFINNPEVKIINVLDYTINKFVDYVNECEIILSSSLHGIICADSYNIPAYWIELSDKVQGKGFKFKDYFMSVNRPIIGPIKPVIGDTIEKFSNKFYEYQIDINLDQLYDSCPFKL